MISLLYRNAQKSERLIQDMKIEEVVIRQRKHNGADLFRRGRIPSTAQSSGFPIVAPRPELKAKTAEVSDAKLGTAEKGKARKATG